LEDLVTKYSGIEILKARNDAIMAKEDTTALLLTKLVWITSDDDRAFKEFLAELVQDPVRVGNVVHSLVGLVVQYSERAAGFLALCEYLTSRIAQRQQEQLPGMTVKW
jgi:hypothetical protein